MLGYFAVGKRKRGWKGDGDAQDEVNVIAEEGAHDEGKYASGEGEH